MTSRPVSGISHYNDSASSSGSPRATPTLERSETRRSTTSDSSTSSMKMPSLKVSPTKRSMKSDKSDRIRSSTSRSSSVYSRQHLAGSTVASSKRTYRHVEYSTHVPVIDQSGKDVTPVSLLSLKPTVLRQHTALQESTHTIKDDPISPPSESSQLFETRSNLSVSRSFFGSESSRNSGASSPDTDDDESRSAPQSPRESPPVPRAQDGLPLDFVPVQPKEEEVKKLTEDELESSVSLLLEETPTIWLLDIPGYVVEKETQEASDVTARNKKYEELVKNRIGNENYVTRGMQTFNNAQKNKDVQVSAPAVKEISTMATIWDIYDAFNVIESDNAKNETDSGASETRSDLQRLAEFDMEPGTWVDVDNTDTSYDSIYARQKKEEISIFKAESFAENLKMMERVIAQNLHSEKLLQYRGIDKLQYTINTVHDTLYFDQSDMEKAQKPQLQFLWKFESPSLTNKPVQCMAWNHSNKDMLAVGYGAINNPNEEGLICVWTLGNVFHPEKIYKTSTTVTSLSFSSQANVSLLAVGLLDGSICIYDLRKRSSSPVLQNTEIQHHDPVWDLKWVDRGPDRGEVLVSASTDGRVLMWDFKKGLEIRSELMRLRRVPGANATGQARNEALIARHAGAFSIDFNSANDPNIYLVGTEDGTIHKCSCSYNEQYLDTYRAHTGPVYKVKWSPFNSGVFISCSADWSTRIWEQDNNTPKITIESENSPFEDVCWANFRSTMFASASNRFVQIWDIEASTLDPVASYELPSQVTTVSFSPDCPAIVAGDASGGVSVFRLMYIVPSQEYDQNKALLKALSPDVLQ